MKWIILSYLVLNPLFFVIGADQRVVQELFFRFSSFLVFFSGFFFSEKKLEFNKINISIGVLSIMLFAQYLITQNGVNIFYNFLAGLLVYLTIIRTLPKEEIRFILRGIIIVSVIAVFVMILQRFGYDWRNATLIHGQTAPRSAFFFQLSALGIYFSETICITLPETWLALLFLYPMKVGLCASAFLGAGAGILFYSWFRKRIMFWILLPLMFIGGIYVMSQSENRKGIEVRIPLWATTFQDVNRKPLGRGLDSFANPKVGGHRHYKYAFSNRNMRVYRKKDDSYSLDEKDKKFFEGLDLRANSLVFQDHPHNEYLWLAYEGGYQSLICLGFIMYFIWLRFYKSIKDKETVGLMSALVCLAIISLTQFPFHMARTGHLLPVLLGLFYVSTKEE